MSSKRTGVTGRAGDRGICSKCRGRSASGARLGSLDSSGRRRGLYPFEHKIRRNTWLSRALPARRLPGVHLSRDLIANRMHRVWLCPSL